MRGNRKETSSLVLADTLEPALHNRRNHCNEKPRHHNCNREYPYSPQLEKSSCMPVEPTRAPHGQLPLHAAQEDPQLALVWEQGIET